MTDEWKSSAGGATIDWIPMDRGGKHMRRRIILFVLMSFIFLLSAYADMVTTSLSLGTPPMMIFIKASIITICLESLVTVFFIRIKKFPARLIISVILANGISLPIVWYVFPLLLSNSPFLFVLLSELFAVIFEAYFIFFTNRRWILFKQAFVLSVIMNSVSFAAGVWIFISWPWFMRP